MITVGDAGWRLEAHHGLAALQAAAGDWAALFARARDATPFQHPAWLLACAQHLAGGEPLVWTLRRAGRLQALLPLVRRPDGGLELLGGPITDYRDVLVDAAADDAITSELLARGLGGSGAGELLLDDLVEGSPLLAAGVPAGWRAETAAATVCPTLLLPAGGADPDRWSSIRLLAEVPRLRRRLAAAGELSTRLAAPGDSDGFIDSLCRLHGERWRGRGQAGVLADRAVHALHRQAARQLVGAGLAELRALCLDGDIIAVLYALVDRRRTCFYLSGFATALARLSPGSVLIGDSIDAAVARGAQEFHFLRGGEAYKYRWGACDRRTWRRRLTRAA